MQVVHTLHSLRAVLLPPFGCSRTYRARFACRTGCHARLHYTTHRYDVPGLPHCVTHRLRLLLPATVHAGLRGYCLPVGFCLPHTVGFPTFVWILLPAGWLLLLCVGYVLPGSTVRSVTHCGYRLQFHRTLQFTVVTAGYAFTVWLLPLRLRCWLRLRLHCGSLVHVLACCARSVTCRLLPDYTVYTRLRFCLRSSGCGCGYARAHPPPAVGCVTLPVGLHTGWITITVLRLVTVYARSRTTRYGSHLRLCTVAYALLPRLPAVTYLPRVARNIHRLRSILRLRTHGYVCGSRLRTVRCVYRHGCYLHLPLGCCAAPLHTVYQFTFPFPFYRGSGSTTTVARRTVRTLRHVRTPTVPPLPAFTVAQLHTCVASHALRFTRFAGLLRLRCGLRACRSSCWTYAFTLLLRIYGLHTPRPRFGCYVHVRVLPGYARCARTLRRCAFCCILPLLRTYTFGSSTHTTTHRLTTARFGYGLLCVTFGCRLPRGLPLLPQLRYHLLFTLPRCRGSTCLPTPFCRYGLPLRFYSRCTFWLPRTFPAVTYHTTHHAVTAGSYTCRGCTFGFTLHTTHAHHCHTVTRVAVAVLAGSGWFLHLPTLPIRLLPLRLVTAAVTLPRVRTTCVLPPVATVRSFFGLPFYAYVYALPFTAFTRTPTRVYTACGYILPRTVPVYRLPLYTVLTVHPHTFAAATQPHHHWMPVVVVTAHTHTHTDAQFCLYCLVQFARTARVLHTGSVPLRLTRFTHLCYHATLPLTACVRALLLRLLYTLPRLVVGCRLPVRRLTTCWLYCG